MWVRIKFINRDYDKDRPWLRMITKSGLCLLPRVNLVSLATPGCRSVTPWFLTPVLKVKQVWRNGSGIPFSWHVFCFFFVVSGWGWFYWTTRRTRPQRQPWQGGGCHTYTYYLFGWLKAPKVYCKCSGSGVNIDSSLSLKPQVHLSTVRIVHFYSLIFFCTFHMPYL